MQALHRAVTAPRLIERGLQVEALKAVLEDVEQGNGRCIFLSGEAGVGKSRLVREFVTDVEADDLVVLQGHCLEQDACLAYATLLDALRRFLTPPTSLEVVDLPGPLVADLIKLLPELALTNPDLPSIPTLPPELEKRRLFESLLQLLLHLAGPGTLLLIIEDIHWSDETSLEFLHLLTRRLPTLPIFLLLTGRSHYPYTPAVTHFLAQLNRERLAQEIRLKPLSPEGVEAMLRSIFDWERPVKPSLLKAIYALTEGNPFFVEEVINTLVAKGDIFYAADRWQVKSSLQLDIPPSLEWIVQQRIDRLNPAAADLLSLAAVAGRHFDFELLAQLTDKEEPVLLELVGELVAAWLVIEESADRFAFRHALTREAIYAGLLRRKRRRLHQTIYHYYQQQPEKRLFQLAYHSFKAGLWEQALQYGQAAGEKALDNFAPRTALTHLERAATAAAELGQPLPMELRQPRGQAQQMVGDFDAAQADFEAVLAEAQAADDLQTEWQALHDLGFLWMTRDYSCAGDYFQRALALARTLDDPLTLAKSLNRLGNWQANVGDPLSALEAHEEALVIFEAEQNRPGIAATLDLIGTAHGVTGNIAASVDYYRRALPLLEALDDWQGVASTLTMLTTGGFIAEGERAVTIAHQIGWRDGEAYAHIQLAMAHALKGEFGPALDHAGRGLHFAREIEHLLWQTVAHQSLGMTYQFMLAFEEAENSLSRALELAKTGCAPVWRDAIAARLTSTRLMSGDVEGATALLADTPTPPPALETLGSRFLALAQGELALARQQPQEALEIINTVLKAVPHLRAWRDHNTLPLLLQLRGRALIAANRLEEAADPLRETISLSRDYEVQVWGWRCHAELSRLHLHRKEYAAAETELSTATRLIEPLAASIPETEQRQQFQETAQAMLPQLPGLSPLQQRKEEFGGLTRRERQVAFLVAQGKTNKEIATELFITVRTVKSHLSNILAKLDFTSRSQVAAWVVEMGLLD